MDDGWNDEDDEMLDDDYSYTTWKGSMAQCHSHGSWFYSAIFWEWLAIYLGCDIGGAKELGLIYFPTNWGAKEPQNLPNHRVATFTMV